MKVKSFLLLTILFSFFTVLSSCENDNPITKEDPKTEEPEPEKPDPVIPEPEIPTPGNGEIKELITAQQFLELFPYRYGADKNNNWIIDPAEDFFSYDALVKAIGQIADIKVVIERKGFFQKITRTQKSTNQVKVIREDADFNASWNTVPVIKEEIDYKNFVNHGSLEMRKKELAAFLANISHETTGGWATAPGGAFSWGLHYRGELGYEWGDKLAYRDESNTNYPPVAGQSYHGRGPIQLSWNYNYGQMSEFLYGDKNVLLKNPGNVTKDAALAFQTAIWFWMTPQSPKPSCHAVMTGKWQPTQQDLNAGRKSGFGMTINIINGGLECNQPNNDKTKDRIGFYQRYLTVLGINDPNCSCQCDQMQSY